MKLRTTGLYNPSKQSSFATPGIPYVHEVSFADIDGDGATDALLFGGSFPGRSEPISRPAYLFLDAGSIYSISPLPNHAALHTSDYEFADFDGNGTLDLFIAASGYDDSEALGEPSYLYVQGTGSFLDANGRLPSFTSFAHGSGSGDIDGDGDADIVVNAQYNDNSQISPFALINDGDGIFTMTNSVMPASSVGRSDYSLERYQWIGLVDVNGDGRSDLITGRERPGLAPANATNKVFLNNGNGFSDGSVIVLPEHPVLGTNGIVTEIIRADIDNDGDQDLILGGHTAEPYGGNWYLQILTNHGTGHFTDVTGSAIQGATSGDGVWMSDYGFSDVNGDEIADIVVQSFQGGSVTGATPIAWLGNGEGEFTPLVASDVVAADELWLLGASSLIWNGESMSLLSFQSDSGATTIWEVQASSVPQVEFGARDRGDIYRDLPSAEQVDGGGGVDTFVLNGKRADWLITQSGDRIQVANGPGDTLLNFERLTFTDGSIGLDLDGVAGQAYRLYQAAFDRTPDTDGLGYWIRELDAGKGDLAWMANNFIISEEFKSTYGSPETVSDEQFLNLLYQNVLNRDADGDGFTYWMNELESGFARERVLASFSESIENQQNVADAIQDGIWYV